MVFPTSFGNGFATSPLIPGTPAAFNPTPTQGAALGNLTATPVFNSDIFKTQNNNLAASPQLAVSNIGGASNTGGGIFNSDIFQTPLQKTLGLNQAVGATPTGSGIFNSDIFRTGSNAATGANFSTATQSALNGNGGVFNSDIFKTGGGSTGLSSANNPLAFSGGLSGTTVKTPGFGSDIFRTGGTVGFGGSLVGSPGQLTTDGTPNLQSALNKIAQDPAGGKLLQAARAKGFNIRVGIPPNDSNLGTASNAIIQGVTTTGGGTNEIVINPNAQDFIKTLAHELYHASTDPRDSVQEEIQANIIGDQISARINGRPPRDPARIAAETRPLYPELPEFNGS